MVLAVASLQLEDAVKDLHARGKGKDANDKFKKIFTECQQAVDSKQLLPMIRTQYMRTAFQVGLSPPLMPSLSSPSYINDSAVAKHLVHSLLALVDFGVGICFQMLSRVAGHCLLE